MSVIEPVKKTIQHKGETKKYSSTLRFWHWANMIVISGSLLTVLLNSTVLKTRNDTPVIKSALINAGATVTDAQARSAAHDLSDKVWDIHVYFGYGLVALFLFRIILEFFQLADQKFIRVLKNAWKNYNQTKKDREVNRHELAVKLIYSAFYILLLIMVITGLFLAFEDFFCMYLVLAFITVHLLGVFLAERKNSKGIVSDMINGGGE
jgi:Ni/Fe-hydrogenase 1 B-type cytochrome subunit